VQVDSIKTVLTLPLVSALKQKYDKLLSNFAFNFNLRRYTQAQREVQMVAKKARGVHITRRALLTCFAKNRDMLSGHLTTKVCFVKAMTKCVKPPSNK